jgi:hypothetical protein
MVDETTLVCLEMMTDCGGTIKNLMQRVGEVIDYDSVRTSTHFNISSYDYGVSKSLDFV